MVPRRSSNGTPAQRPPAVADRAQDQGGLQRLGVRGRPGARRTVGPRDQLVARDGDGLDAVGAEQGRRGGQVAEDDPLATGSARAFGELAGELHLELGGRFVLAALEQAGAELVELELGRVDHHVDVVELTEGEELGRGVRGLGGPATAEQHHLADVAVAQGLQRVIGDIGLGELGDVHGQHPGHVERDVAVADDDRALAGQVEARDRRSPGGRCTRPRTRWRRGCRAGPRPGCRVCGRWRRRPRRSPRGGWPSARRG